MDHQTELNCNVASNSDFRPAWSALKGCLLGLAKLDCQDSSVLYAITSTSQGRPQYSCGFSPALHNARSIKHGSVEFFECMQACLMLVSLITELPSSLPTGLVKEVK